MSDQRKGGANDDDDVIRVGDVKPGEPAQIYLTPYGVVVNQVGGATWHAAHGSTMTLHADNSVEIRNPTVRRIEIDDALLIVDYRMMRTPDTTSHVMEFEGGGVFAYLQDGQGKVIEMALRGGAYMKADWSGNLRIFGCAPDTDAEAAHA
ncbi:hypothetical protein [Variovorax sp. OV329]|uniref:hypothetical protein n=1 Tax=Variovorax sp. OV329 TaxID=1882825 RepID=UPI0008EAEEAA|nr:hypothetical protein [Variovorax sp. OV329]SFM41551.1 hypothetical protein SAMN05444747_105114 [Variovorax sp. OV329]